MGTIIPFKPGDIIADRFRILRMLGQGGFAIVFEARDEKLEQLVAVKMLKAPGGDGFRQEQLDRFEREAKIAAQIPHPAIIRPIDVGQWESVPYIVMEKLEGHPLSKEIWQSGGIEHERAQRLIIGALHALSAAHNKGIIHRDLKPSNLFLSHPGERIESLKILDFGIAFHFSYLDERLTSTEEILGTPSFISPEYAKSRLISPSLDVYQMGLVLAEMIHGERLVERSRWECYLADELWQPIELPENLLSGPFGEVLSKSLEQNHELRYPNAQAMLEGLEGIDLASSLAPPDVHHQQAQLDTTPSPTREATDALQTPSTTTTQPIASAHLPERSEDVMPRRLKFLIGGLALMLLVTTTLTLALFASSTSSTSDKVEGVRQQATEQRSTKETTPASVGEDRKIGDEANPPPKNDSISPKQADTTPAAVQETSPPKTNPKRSKGARKTTPSKPKSPTKESRTPPAPDEEAREALDWLKSSD